MIERPTLVGAIDAGSNAMRAAVALVTPSGSPRILNRLRLPIRLGREVFSEARLAPGVVEQAVEGFRRFEAMFDAYGTSRIRAIGTSAVREARDRDRLIDAVRAATGIVLEPIDGAEEGRLVRTAVTRSFPLDAAPDVVADLGGGSLEVSMLYRGTRVTNAVLPIGTVRLLETLGLGGPIAPAEADRIRDLALRQLREALPSAPWPGAALAVCGGNARALARLVPGPTVHGLDTLDLAALRALVPELCARTVAERMARHAIALDRAEVIAVAAVVLAALGEWAGAALLVVPAVGVLDGVLHELAVLGQPTRLER
jgi:exopolyphosphatase/guanosine-5'-triphosphate,3'-diphosphate pyrophosphatase